MSDFHLAGDLNDDELHYFQTGGDVNENLAKGALSTPPAEAPPAPPEPAPPAAEKTGAAPAPAPRGTEDDGDDPIVPGEDLPRRISRSKYLAVDNARRDLERQLNERSVSQARLEERLNLLTQALQPEQPAGPAKRERPDPNQDIFAAMAYDREQLDSALQEIANYKEQIATGHAEMEEQRRYISSLNSYAASEPNMLDSYNFLLRARAAELMAIRYPQATYAQLMLAPAPDDIAEMVNQEERDLYKGAFQRNSNPAADVFRMAQMRGYRPGWVAELKQQLQPETQPKPNGNGHAAAPAQDRPGTPLAAQPAPRAPAPVPNGGTAPTATAMVDAIRRGAPAAQSLSNVSGNAMPAAPAELTSEALANMDDEQFGKIFNALQNGNTAELRRLMGN